MSHKRYENIFAQFQSPEIRRGREGAPSTSKKAIELSGDYSPDYDEKIRRMTFDHIAAGGKSATETVAFHDSSQADQTVSAENNYVGLQAYTDPADQNSSLTSLPRTKFAP